MTSSLIGKSNIFIYTTSSITNKLYLKKNSIGLHIINNSITIQLSMVSYTANLLAKSQFFEKFVSFTRDLVGND